MISITGTPQWTAGFPGAMIGVLEISGVDNTVSSPSLVRIKRETEARLRRDYSEYTRKDFLSLPVLAANERYYRRFDKTCHVLLQVESIVLKGKNLPDVSPLVDANFAAEMSTMVLTAGHDADRLIEPTVIDVSNEDDELTQMNGVTRLIRAGDMVMRDYHGICCSIIYGQDNLSPITTATRHALYVAYNPPGVPEESVWALLREIEENVKLFAPQAIVEQNRILKA